MSARKRIIVAVAGVAIAVGTLAGGFRVYAALFGGPEVPNYEPIQYNGKDSLTPAQKAKFQEIYNFAVADMERRRVSARKFNQFLWQMHFFVPVHYKLFDCAELNKKAPLAERASDYVAMGEAMRDTHDAFPMALPMLNTKAQSSGQGDISLDGLHREDSLQVYSAQIWEFMLMYRKGFWGERNYKGKSLVKDSVDAGESEASREFFDPSEARCVFDGMIFLRNGFSINHKYTSNYFGQQEPIGIPASPRPK